jgi:hypothetical protein
MVYPYPTNITGFGEILVYTNTISNGIMGLCILLPFTVVMFILMGAGSRGMIVAGLTGTILAVMLNVMGVVNTSIITLYIIGTLLGLGWNWVQN